MAAVFPENMDKLDVNNPSTSLATVEKYIRYMGERIEFAMRNVTRNVSAAGVSSAEVYQLLMAISNDLSALKSTVNGMTGQINSITSDLGSLGQQVSDISKTLEATNTAVSSLEERVSALESE